MIEKYWEFNIDAFFSQYDQNKQKLKWQRQLLQSTDGMKAIEYDSVGGGRGNKISDPTFNAAEKREGIQNEIRGLEEYFERYDILMSYLTQDEKAIIDCKYYGGDKEELHISPSEYSRQLFDLKQKIKGLMRWG